MVMVTLEGDEFKGFMIQARDPDEKVVGEFSDLPR
jgi:hypothetical protein